MQFVEAIFSLFEKAVYFSHEGMKFLGVLLNRSLRTKFPPGLSLVALHSFGLQTF
jgi:hypothetical protein